MAFLAGIGVDRAKHFMVGAAGQVDQLPGGGQFVWKTRDIQIFDQHAEDALVQPVGQVELAQAPLRTQPVRRHQKQHRIAAVGRIVQRPLPALAGDNAAFGVEIQKQIVPAFRAQPVGQGQAAKLSLLEWLRKSWDIVRSQQVDGQFIVTGFARSKGRNHDDELAVGWYLKTDLTKNHPLLNRPRCHRSFREKFLRVVPLPPLGHDHAKLLG